jgi:hypothetical protein
VQYTLHSFFTFKKVSSIIKLLHFYKYDSSLIRSMSFVSHVGLRKDAARLSIAILRFIVSPFCREDQLHRGPAIQRIQYGVNLMDDTVGGQYIGYQQGGW